MSISPQGDPKGSCQSKIGKLQITVAVNEQILRFEVTVQNAVAVAVANALDELGHKLLDHGIAQAQVGTHHGSVRECLSPATFTDRQGLHVFFQIKIQELEDEV